MLARRAHPISFPAHFSLFVSENAAENKIHKAEILLSFALNIGIIKTLTFLRATKKNRSNTAYIAMI